ncbi:hypothetical protein CCP3SC15_550017 [Gammaproteobacteria bacterium]
MSIDEAASWFIGDKTNGSIAASLIGSGKGTYTQFRNLGYSATIARQLTVLGLMQASSEAMLNQQYTHAQQILSSNSGAAADSWPGLHLGQIRDKSVLVHLIS